MKLLLFVLVGVALAASQYVDNLVDIPDTVSGRITGGVEVEPPHSLPYQVGLFINMSQGIAFCGGSLLNEEWVLTAAHCAQPGWSFEVILGAHYIRDSEEATQVHVTTTDKHVHPRWNRLTLLNDIALLRLPAPITYTAAIQPIRLPTYSASNQTDGFNGTEALMSGWGKQTDNSTSISDTLQAINKTVISQEICSPFYGGVLNETAHICTRGSNGQSTCNGDSGGPLVYREESDGRFSQIGVVSFGIAFGCEVNWPPVFTRLTSYLDWIEETTGIPVRP